MGWGVHDYPSPPDPDEVICPECGESCSTIYILDGHVIGCDCCIEATDAFIWREENV